MGGQCGTASRGGFRVDRFLSDFSNIVVREQARTNRPETVPPARLVFTRLDESLGPEHSLDMIAESRPEAGFSCHQQFYPSETHATTRESALLSDLCSLGRGLHPTESIGRKLVADQLSRRRRMQQSITAEDVGVIEIGKVTLPQVDLRLMSECAP